MVESAELLKKLQVKAGARLWLINVPRPFVEALTAGGEGEAVQSDQAFDGVVAFCENPAEVASRAAQILPKLPDDGLLWFAYRKGSAARNSGLSRDVGWSALTDRGYGPVRSIAFDEEWTGLRFRHNSVEKSRQ